MSLDIGNAFVWQHLQFHVTVPGDRSPTLYIVAVSKADQAVEIIRSKAAGNGDEVEDLGRVAGFLVQEFKLAPGEFIRVDNNYKPQGR